jgi:hypothetical protein
METDGPSAARQRVTRRWLGAALTGAGLAPPALAAADIWAFRPGSITRAPQPGEPGAYVPPVDLKTVADIYSRMTTPVRINGQGPFPFVVDTGANQSAIATDVAARIGLVVGEEAPVNTIAGVELAPTTRATLQAGDLAGGDVVLSVLPASAIGGAGMLGLDALSAARITLDFARQSVRIDGPRGLPGLGGEVSLKAQMRAGQLTLIDADVGGIKLTAFLDSGAQDTVGNMALRSLAYTRYPATIWSQVPILSVTGRSVIGEFADLPRLRIGSLSVASWPIAFADLHIFRLWKLIDRPAILLGIDVLSRFETVCLDFSRNEVRLRLPATAPS